MTNDPFQILETCAQAEGMPAAFDRLVELLREEKKYPQLFEARLMKKRHELGLPLQGTDSINDLPEELQDEVEKYYVEVCREVGALFLADGDIAGAWPYYRAIDEKRPIADAIADWAPPGDTEDEDALTKLDEIVGIALTEGAAPARGYELVLSEYGVCRAITVFEHQFPYQGEVREACGRLLIERLYADLSENVRSDVLATSEANDEVDAPPEDADLRTLVEQNSWLFEGMGYHVDVSHLMAVVRVAATMKDRALVEKGIQLTEYGRRLGRDFQHPDQPPFEDFYNDYRIYLRALAGEGVDGAVRYFTQAADRHDVDEEGRHFPGEVLVYLLYRTGQYEKAIAAYRKYLSGTGPQTTIAPSLSDLCSAKGDFAPLLEVSREQSDLLQFAAGLAQSRGVETAD